MRLFIKVSNNIFDLLKILIYLNEICAHRFFGAKSWSISLVGKTLHPFDIFDERYVLNGSLFQKIITPIQSRLLKTAHFDIFSHFYINWWLLNGIRSKIYIVFPMHKDRTILQFYNTTGPTPTQFCAKQP